MLTLRSFFKISMDPHDSSISTIILNVQSIVTRSLLSKVYFDSKCASAFYVKEVISLNAQLLFICRGRKETTDS